MNRFQKLLIELNACEEAKTWVENKSIETIVKTCHRGDWLLWLGKRIDIDFQMLTLAKGYCANTVIHLMKDGRSINAVKAAINFGKGLITKEELAAAAAAAPAAYAAADVHAADAVKIKSQLETSIICKEYIGQLIIDKVNELYNL